MPAALSKPGRRRRTPTVLQMEAVECGAAALGSVLAFFGRHVPLEELRITCGVSRDGSNAANVVAAARHYGLEAAGYRKEVDELKQLTLPVIVFWNFNHFLVVEGFGKNGVYVNDPATGPRTVSDEEFDESFTGVVLTFEPGPTFQPGGQPPGFFRGLAPRLAGARLALTFVVLATLGLVIPGLVVPAAARIFIDDVLVAGRHDWIRPLLLTLALTALVRGVLTWLQQYYLMRLDVRLALTMASQFVWHVLRLPVEFYQQRYAGDINARIASNDRVAQLLSGQLATTLANMLAIVFYLAVMIWYDVPLTLLAVAIAALNVAALHYVSRWRADQNRNLLQNFGKMMATGMGGLEIIETLKATASEGDFFSRWAGHQAKVINGQQELGAATTYLNAAPVFLTSLSTVAILGFGGLQVMSGKLTLGELVAFQALTLAFTRPVNQLVGFGGSLQEIEGDLARLDDVLHYRLDDAIRPDDGEALAQRRLTGQVELRDVTFGYSPLGEPLLRNLSLHVKPGSRIALVGASGSGKSTIARLVAGLFHPWSGAILFDGKPRGAIPRAAFVQSLAMVDQDIFLYEGTVRDNLTLWDATVPEVRMIQAARDACIHDDVVSRGGGYDSLVEERGRNFSGGQRQRLEIARALVNDPAIVVLDEATSALDAETERLIDDNLRRRGCTCIIVAHRLSTIRDCDEILVLDNGRVVERGRHDDLIQHDGPYARLIQAD
ncbi:MAG: NHLP family bacteriocin export ABC transporter peptidase/permease/ATPase subunit [Gemmataceae bacterium]